MTSIVFDTMFNRLMGCEGAYQCDPRDRGNWTSGKCGVGECKGTKFGVSAMAYPNLDIKNLTIKDAKYIFQKDYWDKCKCDYLPDCISVLVSDYAYNSGRNRAIKSLQGCLKIKADGIIGNQTLCAVNSANKKKLVEDYCHSRLEFLKTCKTWHIYGKGWTNRVNDMQKMAESLI